MKITLTIKRLTYEIVRLSILHLTLSLLFSGISLATAVNGQDMLQRKVTVHVKSKPISAALETIEKSAKVKFSYNSRLVDLSHIVSISVDQQPLTAVLESLLAPHHIHYLEVSNRIVLRNKTAVSTNGASHNLMNRTSESLDYTVKGRVTDEGGLGLPGVSIVVKGTSQGTTTDVEGAYSIVAPDAGATLVYSYVGYVSQEVGIDKRSQIDISLAVDTKALEEIIVVGYGSQKKRDLTGAISSINSRDIAETPSSNFLSNAQGRLAGVDIVRSNGNPGSAPTIRIRGNRSINASNNPLYVIDGIPTDVSINDFNPNDIESMEVLKDASSVAIYGSRGANGVILITTKKGKEGKAVISYDGYYGIKKAKKNLNLMNGEEFVRYSRVARGIDVNDSSKDPSFFSTLEIDNLQNGVETDWLDLILRDGQQQQHQISASGGNKNTTYYLSGAFYDEKGIMQLSDYQRYSFRVNIESELTKRLRVGVSATVATDLQNIMTNEPYSNALQFSPLVQPYDEQGSFIAYPNPREGLLTSPLLQYQPGQFTNEKRKYRVFANIFAEYKFMEGLTYRLNFGPDFNTSRMGQYTGTLAGSANMATVGNEQNFAYTLENILSYNRNIQDHSLNVVGLFSTQTNRFESSGASARNIPVESSLFYNLGSAETVTGINSALTQWGLVSYMARINYSFKNRYLLTLTGRADGSSRLSQKNKWAFFPSVSAGWVLSDEAFMSNTKVLSFLKIRAGYGAVGNTSISPYQTLGGLERSIYAYGNDPAFGYALNVIPNPDLRWEISSTVNIGLDFGVLNDRITGSLELYKTNTTDLLLNRLIPITSGYESVLQNIGATSNQGWELSLNGNILNTSNGFKWDANLNIFSNKEKIVQLFNGKDDIGNQWFIGQPINVFYSYKQEGIWQTNEAVEATNGNQKPGDIKIADVNGRDEEGNLTNSPDGQINADDRTVLGSTVPKWSGGLTNRISYKGVDFSFLVYARQGQYINSGFHNLGGNNWQGRYNAINFDYWTPENPVNKIPMPTSAAAPLYSDALRYYDGSFLKIRNITLGYSIPKSLTEKMKISSLRFYATADNALIFSPYKLVDPENSNGTVGGGNPMTSATYVFGLNLKF
ncbi:TonB-linked SusC/RagA family outer membrane protein [Dyadobacter jejuensis]|uniref:TonB-linked SusC/RagA family outer membrane protein n=1 Tax=Dyadobacter jejuensis TaxID=1082580 RepID=A0A316AXV9_9BACT|nr:TonB-dependent receptor [Dyadobacter jejuensis]PWJ55047.1 TonB-linked SusC/RagA family outer membrane protein [Dyadobacter jejuensis]